MRTLQSTLVIWMLCVVCGCSNHPDIHTLLDNYIAASNWANNVSYEIHSDSTARIIHGSETKVLHITVDLTHRRDPKGNAEWFGTSNWTKEGDANYINQDTGDFFRLYSDNSYIVSTRHATADHWGGIITHLQASRDVAVNDMDPYYGGFFYGKGVPRTLVFNKHLGEFLKELDELKIQEETVEGILCYKVHADTKHGDIAVWIAPDFGYNAIQMSWICDQHDTLGPTATSPNLGSYSIKAHKLHVDSLKYEKRGDIFVPIAGHMITSDEEMNGDSREDTFDVSMRSIDLNPDFEKLGAFRINLPEGTVIGDYDNSKTRYQVIDSNLVPL